MKKKLIKIIDDVLRYLPWGEVTPHTAEDIAERLIENGMTIATDTNVGDKWISVEDRLPEESDEYLAYCGEYDGICVLHHEVLETKSWWITQWKEVTHWMPLPEPPSESTVTVEDECNDEDWGC